MNKFELGKTYKSVMGTVFKPQFIGTERAFGIATNSFGVSGEEAIHHSELGSSDITKRYWKEYREPVVQTGIRYVIGQTDTESGFFTSEHSWHKGKIFGKYKITVTDDKLTDLEILDD